MNVRFAAHYAFMSCAFPFHPPMKVANLTFISYNTYILIHQIFIV